MRIVLLVFGNFMLSSSPAAKEEKLRTSTVRVCRNRGNVSSSRRVRWNHVTAQSIRGCAVKTKEGVQCRFVLTREATRRRRMEDISSNHHPHHMLAV